MFVSLPGDPIAPHPLGAEAVLTAAQAVERPDKAAMPSDPALFGEMLDLILRKSGLTQAEVARRLASKPQSVHQYRTGVRPNPSLRWFLRFVHICGAKIVIELPSAEL